MPMGRTPTRSGRWFGRALLGVCFGVGLLAISHGCGLRPARSDQPETPQAKQPNVADPKADGVSSGEPDAKREVEATGNLGLSQALSDLASDRGVSNIDAVEPGLLTAMERYGRAEGELADALTANAWASNTDRVSFQSVGLNTRSLALIAQHDLKAVAGLDAIQRMPDAPEKGAGKVRTETPGSDLAGASGETKGPNNDDGASRKVGEPETSKPADLSTGSVPPSPAPTAPAPTAPSGSAVGNPPTGVTAEQRRERVTTPARVGADEGREDARPRFDEELWVITRPTRGEVKALERGLGGEQPAGGSLMLRPVGGGRSAAAKNLSTDVMAHLTGPVSRVTVEQRFENSGADAAEAVYVLPLPTDAAVTDFVLRVGARRIRGVIRERAEAERIFLDATNQGKVAALFLEDRANLFVQRIGMVPAGAEVGASVSYFHTLAYVSDGTGGMGAFDFVMPGWGGLGEWGVRRMTVEIDSGTAIRAIASPTHEIEVTATSDRSAKVTVRGGVEGVSGEDLIVRYAVAGDRAGVGVVMQADGDGAYVSLVIVPPTENDRGPIEMVVVPGVVGSEEEAGRDRILRGAARVLMGLRPSDMVGVWNGNGLEMKPATVEHVRAAIEGLRTLGDAGARLLAATAGGGGPQRVVCLVAGGGFDPGIDAVRGIRAGAARVFAMPADGATAGFAMESVARVGRGGVVHLPEEGAALGRVVERFLGRECVAVMTDLEIDWGGAEVADVFPRRLPDLTAGRPVHVVARVIGMPAAGGPGVRVNGRGADGGKIEIAGAWGSTRVAEGAVACLWARAKVLSLGERARTGDESARREMVALALRHNLVSSATGFVAVDAMSGDPAGGAVSGR